MTWSDEVHASRLASTLSAARETRSYRVQKQRVPLSPTASPLQVVAMVGAAAGFLLFKRHGPELHKVQWRQVPIIKQFHDLVFGSKGTKLGSGPKGKAKKQKAKAPATAAAIKEALKPTATVKPTKATPAKPDAAAPKTAAKPSDPVPDAPAKAGAAMKTAPAPLQQSHIAPFQKPAGKPAAVNSGAVRAKPAAKPATSVGLQRNSSGGGAAPSLMSPTLASAAPPVLSPATSATPTLISDARS